MKESIAEVVQNLKWLSLQVVFYELTHLSRYGSLGYVFDFFGVRNVVNVPNVRNDDKVGKI